jgi:hypothetical protein
MLNNHIQCELILKDPVRRNVQSYLTFLQLLAPSLPGPLAP